MLEIQMHNNISPSSLHLKCTRAEKIVAQQIFKDTTPFVPALTLAMNNASHVEGNVIIYKAPYARYLYYGKVMVGQAPKQVTNKDLVFTTSVHSKAQSFWIEASKAQNMEKWKRVIKKAVTE